MFALKIHGEMSNEDIGVCVTFQLRTSLFNFPYFLPYIYIFFGKKLDSFYDIYHSFIFPVSIRNNHFHEEVAIIS